MAIKMQISKTGMALALVLFPVFNLLKAQANDELLIQLNKTSFAQGDTINIEAMLPNYKIIGKTSTLQLWVEHIKSGKKWKMRYPLVNGYINAKLKIDSAMGGGAYAFNFLLQKSFFSIAGHVSNADKKDKQLNYAMISKNKQAVMDAAVLDEQKNFSVRNLLFQDSAFIIFSRPKQKTNDLLIDIKTPLDSAFTPVATVTKFVVVGDTATPLSIADTSAYLFNAAETQYKIMMPEVVVKVKSNKRLEDFDSENSTGSFAMAGDAILLDGLSSSEIADAPDLYLYLSRKVGGLRVITDNETGNRTFLWRGQPTEVYINEIRLDAETPLWINPADIAMIKVFRPGTQLMADAAAGGAIAIYTKTGEYRQSNNRNYSFYILGYTGLESVWK